MGLNTPLVWVVDSAYTGELHARLGVAERLGYGYEMIPLPNGDARAYARLLENRYGHACRNGEPRPLILLSGTGEDTIGPIADLKSLFQARLLNVYLASILPDEPDLRLQEYDLVASPQLSGANVVTTVGVVHRMTERLLNQAFHRHRDVFAGLARPLVGLLVGGNTRYCFNFNEAMLGAWAGGSRASSHRSRGAWWSPIADEPRKTLWPPCWTRSRAWIAAFSTGNKPAPIITPRCSPMAMYLSPPEIRSPCVPKPVTQASRC